MEAVPRKVSSNSVSVFAGKQIRRWRCPRIVPHCYAPNSFYVAAMEVVAYTRRLQKIAGL